MTQLFNESRADTAEITGIPLGSITSYNGATPLLASKGENTPQTAQFSTETGEILKPEYSPVAATIERYSLQRASCEILSTKRGKRDRTLSCLRTILSGADGVLVKQSIKTGKCYFKNLMCCGSVWKCPLCNAKISEARAKEIKLVMEAHIKAGGKVALLTFTIPHKRYDDLKFMVKTFQKAFNRMWTSEPAKRLRISIEMDGYARSKETTWSTNNGHHPHYHQIVLYSSDKSEEECMKEMKEVLSPIWSNRCEKVGLGSPSYEHGLDVRNGMNAAAYIAKFEKDRSWGLEKELTKSQSKKSKGDSYSPWDFLREHKKTGSKEMARLFLEYADAFQGSQFVTWSPGLKDKYDIDDSLAKDKELAKTSDEASKTLAQITHKDWKKIEFHHKRANVQILAEKGWTVTKNYIDSLPRPYKKNRKKNPL